MLMDPHVVGVFLIEYSFRGIKISLPPIDDAVTQFNANFLGRVWQEHVIELLCSFINLFDNLCAFLHTVV